MEKIFNGKFELKYLQEDFFDSLRQDYKTFDDWFKRSCSEGNKKASYITQNDKILAFFGYKIEEGKFDSPLDYQEDAYDENIINNKRIKITTLKSTEQLKRMAEFAISNAYNYAIEEEADYIYLTIVEDTENKKKLSSILRKHGFVNVGYQEPTRNQRNDKEYFYIKYLNKIAWSKDVKKTLPLVPEKPFSLGVKVRILPIKDKWHDKMFPLNQLKNVEQKADYSLTVSHSLKKTYIHSMSTIASLNVGDICLMYRMGEGPRKGYKNSVTGIAYVEKQYKVKDFDSFEDFKKQFQETTVFTKEELFYLYKGTTKFVTELSYVRGFGEGNNGAHWVYLKNHYHKDEDGRPQEWNITDLEYKDIIKNKGGLNVRNFTTN